VPPDGGHRINMSRICVNAREPIGIESVLRRDGILV
jgi:hypothetical protein